MHVACGPCRMDGFSLRLGNENQGRGVPAKQNSKRFPAKRSNILSGFLVLAKK